MDQCQGLVGMVGMVKVRKEKWEASAGLKFSRTGWDEAWVAIGKPWKAAGRLQQQGSQCSSARSGKGMGGLASVGGMEFSGSIDCMAGMLPWTAWRTWEGQKSDSWQAVQVIQQCWGNSGLTKREEKGWQNARPSIPRYWGLGWKDGQRGQATRGQEARQRRVKGAREI